MRLVGTLTDADDEIARAEFPAGGGHGGKWVP